MTGPLESTHLPNRFRRARLCDVAQVNARSLPSTTDPGYAFRYVDIGSVSAFGEIDDLQLVTFADAPSRARRVVQVGDIIVSTVRTYLRAIARVRDAEDVIASTGFAVVTPSSAINPDYLYWWLCGHPFVEQIVSESVGVSYPAINA